MVTIDIQLNEYSYPIHIGHGLLSTIDTLIDVSRQIVIITDDFIPKIYLNTIQSKLNSPLVFEVPNGENSKSMEIVYSIINEMLESNITRKCLVIALGGGVIGDLAGFISSIYMRGVDFIQIPTTLLSQIDSSVGGKVGINSDTMKNSIGSFYQPKMVIIDIDTLQTLSKRQFNNGIAEMIKYGMIADKSLFSALLNNGVSEETLDLYIQKCINIKKSYVQNDVYDQGKRQILNYGHTIGHAIEQDSKYSILHGESIAIGMVQMSKGRPFYNQLISLLTKYSLPIEYKKELTKLIKYIKTDKKVLNNILNLIVVEELGKGFIKPININDIRKYL